MPGGPATNTTCSAQLTGQPATRTASFSAARPPTLSAVQNRLNTRSGRQPWAGCITVTDDGVNQTDQPYTYLVLVTPVHCAVNTDRRRRRRTDAKMSCIRLRQQTALTSREQDVIVYWRAQWQSTLLLYRAHLLALIL